MKYLFTSIGFIFFTAITTHAQVKQAVLVEHFTNTRCGICANRNPGLFTNLANNPEVLHIATHPSSPYSSCVLYQHNTIENNARTNYYGVLGSTPRIVINGTVMSGGTSFTSSTLFDNFNTKMSPISIAVNQQKFGMDSIRATITVKSVAAHLITTALMYVPLVEDSLMYNAPNGENLHHNVFRKSFSNGSIQLPALGDSSIYIFVLAGNNAWNFDKLKTMVILSENSSKKVIQAAEYKYKAPVQNTNTLESISSIKLEIFPNPSKAEVTINSDETGTMQWVNSLGQTVKTVQTDGEQTVKVNDLPPGIYSIILQTNKGNKVSKWVKL